MYVCTCVCVCACMCACLCAHVCVCVHVCVYGSHMVYPAVGQVEAVSLLHYYLVPWHRCEIRVGRHVHSKVKHRKLNRYVARHMYSYISPQS